MCVCFALYSQDVNRLQLEKLAQLFQVKLLC